MRGRSNANFTVTLAAASGKTVTVDYATGDVSATQPADYTQTSGPTFTPGQTTKTVTVPVKGDTLDEINETFSVALSGAVNTSLSDATGTGTITDDDTARRLDQRRDRDRHHVNAIFTISLGGKGR